MRQSAPYKEEMYLRFKETGCCPHCDHHAFFIRARAGQVYWEYTCKGCKLKWGRSTININDGEIHQ